MKIISWNINGIRSILKKDVLYPFISNNKPDIICFQEVRALPTQVKFEDSFNNTYPYRYWNNPLEKKGYSGTAIFSTFKPLNIINGIGIDEHDVEGRVITAEFDNYYLVNVYVPNSKMDLSRLDYRVNSWDTSFRNFVERLEKTKPVIVCGDFNSIHRETLDIWNPKIKKTAGVTPEEKQSFELYLNTFVDSFRFMNPEKIKYSWWSNMGKSRDKNNGWRIDYFLVSRLFTENIIESDILDHIHGSDHAPCLLTIS
jgi:exodeoxyribonuclease-3